MNRTGCCGACTDERYAEISGSLEGLGEIAFLCPLFDVLRLSQRIQCMLIGTFYTGLWRSWQDMVLFWAFAGAIRLLPDLSQTHNEYLI